MVRMMIGSRCLHTGRASSAKRKEVLAYLLPAAEAYLACLASEEGPQAADDPTVALFREPLLRFMTARRKRVTGEFSLPHT